MADKTFHRSTSDRIFGGVCGGFAEYSGLPAWAIRLVFCILTLCTFGIFGIILYILMWWLIPDVE